MGMGVGVVGGGGRAGEETGSVNVLNEIIQFLEHLQPSLDKNLRQKSPILLEIALQVKFSNLKFQKKRKEKEEDLFFFVSNVKFLARRTPNPSLDKNLRQKPVCHYVCDCVSLYLSLLVTVCVTVPGPEHAPGGHPGPLFREPAGPRAQQLPEHHTAHARLPPYDEDEPLPRLRHPPDTISGILSYTAIGARPAGGMDCPEVTQSTSAPVSCCTVQ